MEKSIGKGLLVWLIVVIVIGTLLNIFGLVGRPEKSVNTYVVPPKSNIKYTEEDYIDMYNEGNTRGSGIYEY
ncbi:hypothetical protein KJ652_06095 [Patescibacteria group bacterium]|nr:hypothetical protein [Patescibacteria group bacterium]